MPPACSVEARHRRQANPRPGRPWIALALFTVADLPFLTKPFHIDDPVYLWVARQIQSRPLDFYGFTVNWYGTAESVAEVMQNPPLTSYYVALAALVGGWGEVAIHLAMLLPALGVILGTFRLARTLDADPLISVLLLAFTPAFLVSATTVMSDVLALCLWGGRSISGSGASAAIVMGCSPQAPCWRARDSSPSTWTSRSFPSSSRTVSPGAGDSAGGSSGCSFPSP